MGDLKFMIKFIKAHIYLHLLAEEARNSGIKEVCISGFYFVSNINSTNTVIYNQFLQMRCENMCFKYISQTDSGPDDLYDRLHVNNTSGHDKLKHWNI